MKKKTAILIDGGLLRAKIKQKLLAELRNAGQPTLRLDGSEKQIHDMVGPEEFARRAVRFAKNCLDRRFEDLYRIFYYDCPPYTGGPSIVKPHPFGATTPIVEQTAIDHQTQFLNLLRSEEFVAVREGQISFDGWIPMQRQLRDVILTGRPLMASDFRPDLKQKGVDLKIGVDTVLLARDRIVERIILVVSDSDLVPAMKLARREGIQIVLISLGAMVKRLLREHADIYRSPRY